MISTSVQADSRLNNLIENLRRVDSVVREDVWEKSLDVAYEMEARIKDAMPVDTGRAKASWGHFTQEDLRPGAERIGKGKRITKRTKFRTAEGLNSGRTQIANAGDAIWIEDRANLTVEQGTLVNYVEQLNEGHSTQAPAGFIDEAENAAQIQFENYGAAVEELVLGVLEGRSVHTTKSGKRDRRYKK